MSNEEIVTELHKISSELTSFKLNRLSAIEAIKCLAAKIKVEKNKYKLYQEFVSVYLAWQKKEVGIYDMSSTQGKAMKDIIKKLLTADTINSEEEALVAWKFVLQHWDRLNEYLKGRRTLVQINQNFVEILTKIKHGTGTASKVESAARDLEQRRQAIGK